MSDLCPVCLDPGCIHSAATPSPPPPGVPLDRWRSLVSVCRAYDTQYNPSREDRT